MIRQWFGREMLVMCSISGVRLRKSVFRNPLKIKIVDVFRHGSHNGARAKQRKTVDRR